MWSHFIKSNSLQLNEGNCDIFVWDYKNRKSTLSDSILSFVVNMSCRKGNGVGIRVFLRILEERIMCQNHCKRKGPVFTS